MRSRRRPLALALALSDGQLLHIPAHLAFGNILTVDSEQSGSEERNATRTIQGALDRANPGDLILVAPGEYNEALSIGRTRGKVAILGAGGRGACFNVAPDGETGLICHADDVTLINFGIEAADAEIGSRIYGARLRAFGCKFEGGAEALRIGPGAAADVEADDEGDAADALFEDCEFCWSDVGVKLMGSDYGAVTQARIRRSLFHNLADAHVSEGHEAGGAAGVRFRDLEMSDCRHMRNEDGSAPTKFFDLNADNGNTGAIFRPSIAFATNEADVIALGTGVLWVAAATEAGISAARPA